MVKTVRGLAIVSVAVAACALAPVSASANSKYAGIVLDAKTGKVLYSRNADAPRYPASLTKMMTLYVLFEELEAGRVSLNTRFKVSKNAAARPPSKLGLKPGSTIAVRDAIGALVTKSANDIAVTIAENISGSHAAFARRMTATAHRIGMRRTTFRNASGLPNSAQKTTARDMARLGLALQDHFPEYYKYFSMRTFTYSGRRYGNHNRLLGRVKGVDGIKTGYTRASGFNLVSSVKHRDRHIIAVVMGGKTGRSRDAQMKKLIAGYLTKARTGKRTTPMIAGRVTPSKQIQLANAPLPTAKPAIAQEPVLAQVAAATAVPLPQPVTDTKTSDARTAEKAEDTASAPIVVATAETAIPTPTARINAAYELKMGASGNGPLHLDGSTPKAQPKPALASITPPAVIPFGYAETPTTPSGKPQDDVMVAALPPLRASDAAAGDAKSSDRVETTATIPAPSVPTAKVVVAAATPRSAPEPMPAQVKVEQTGTSMVATNDTSPPPSGWVVQIAAAQSQEGALDLLKKAKLKAGKVLAASEIYTEAVESKGETLYRARFVGFESKASAKAACRSLKKAKFACYHLHQ